MSWDDARARKVLRSLFDTAVAPVPLTGSALPHHCDDGNEGRVYSLCALTRARRSRAARRIRPELWTGPSPIFYLRNWPRRPS
jgi:hypothetical protein